MRNGLAIDPSIMTSDRRAFAHIQPVTTGDFFEGGTEQFHPEGLFSPEIFGRLGSEERSTRVSWIDLKAKVIHPLVYLKLEKLKNMYVGIMSGTVYATWNDKLKDFERSDALNGQTGYAFFCKHLPDVKFTKTSSDQRDLNIKLVDIADGDLFRDTCIVIAAASRELLITEDGRPQVDEINEYYRKLIAVSRTIASDPDSSVHDTARWSMQRTMVELYQHIFNLIFGKDRHASGKWASRAIFNSTRNVITSMNTTSRFLKGAATPMVTDTMVGVYQQSKAMLPHTVHAFLMGPLSRVIDRDAGTALVFNHNGLKPIMVNMSRQAKDLWTTSDGINKILTRFGDPSSRHYKSTIDGHYVGLLWQDDKHFKLILADEVEQGSVPEEYLKQARPITRMELVYILIYKKAAYSYGTVTRYPVTGLGSTYPSRCFLRSTNIAKELKPLDENFNPIEDPDALAVQFPIMNGEDTSYYDGMSPHPSALGDLGADFDGDTTTWTCWYTANSEKELREFLYTRRGLIDPRGGLRIKPETDSIKWVLKGLTSGIKPS